MNKFILGSAQMGMSYGVSNKLGKVRSVEAKKIINFAERNNIQTIDTAMNYGSSEELLGKICDKSWKIITKIPKFPDNLSNISSWFDKKILKSLESLKRTNIDTLLVHEPKDLKNNLYGKDLISLLMKLKNEGVINNIGISIYDSTSLKEYIDLIEVDIVQAPVNIFDRRIIDSGWANKLNSLGIEVHARSIFLQGLLLMKSSDRPKFFHKWNHIWKTWDNFLIENNISALEACIYHVNKFSNIDKILIGVESQQQLKQILDFSNQNRLNLNFDDFCLSDEDLINPSRWV